MTTADVLNLNIPSVTVSRVIDMLTVMYSNAINNNIPFKDLPTCFLWGGAGIGKSQGIRQLAERLEAETGKRVHVTDIRLLLFSPVDLRGIPTAVNGELTRWLRPEIFNMDESDDVINILFMDELSAAPVSVQAAAYQLSLDRACGEHRLPENCLTLCAGNRLTDQSVSVKMPKALCNRLMHFNIKADYPSWRAWAVKNGISHKVISYLAVDSARLCVEPEAADLAYCTPRSWAFVSTLLNTVNDDPRQIHDLIAACVGKDTAIAFEAFCKGTLDMPSVKDILGGSCNTMPKSYDVMHALTSRLVTEVTTRAGDITVSELDNVCRYVMRFPKDFAMSFMRDINLIEEINKKLMKCQGFQTWLNKYGMFM